MKIAVIGTGYVGLVSGACFAKMGNSVICVDIDENKIAKLKNGEITIFEPGLDKIVVDCMANGDLNFTTQLKEALDFANIVFIAVGTPMGADGAADLKFVLGVAKNIGQMMQKELFIVDKSTVPVGTADLVYKTIQDELELRGANIPFHVISNPEFLKEGAAVDDFLKPDRIVIGANDEKSFEIMREIYSPFMKNHDKLIEMDLKSAEMTKYASNSMLATKISFMNEIANICEKVGADVNLVRKGIGSDNRIGFSFIYPGCGYGGSCFPKDVDALIYTAKENGVNPLILDAIRSRNEAQKRVIFEKVNTYFNGNLKGKNVAVWGLSFKPNTDDMREAPSILIVNLLAQNGVNISVYDPKAYKEAKIYFKNLDIEYCENKYEALKNADCMVLLTEWSEFRSPDFSQMKKLMKQAVIFDGRNQYNSKNLIELGFKYFQIGVRAD